MNLSKTGYSTRILWTTSHHANHYAMPLATSLIFLSSFIFVRTGIKNFTFVFVSFKRQIIMKYFQFNSNLFQFQFQWIYSVVSSFTVVNIIEKTINTHSCLIRLGLVSLKLAVLMTHLTFHCYCTYYYTLYARY